MSDVPWPDLGYKKLRREETRGAKQSGQGKRDRLDPVPWHPRNE